MTDGRWIGSLCLARVGFALIFVAYSASLGLLKQDWGLSSAQAGLIQSAFHIGYLVSLFAIGFFADRYGAKRTFLATSIAACASGLAFALFADGFVSALLLHGLTGLCSGGSYTPGLTLIAERFPAARRGRAMGYYLAASSLGYAVSLWLSSVLIVASGWRAALIACAFGPVAASLLAAWVLRGTRNVVHPAGYLNPLRALLDVWRNRPAMLAVWAYVFHSWELLGMWAWMPTYLGVVLAHGRESSAGMASLGIAFAALSYLISTAGSIGGGVLSDRWGRTAVILLMSIASLVCSFTFGWLIAAPAWIVVAVAIAYNLTAIGDSSVYSTAMTELVPAHCLGAAFALRSVLGFGVGAISPWVFGLVLDLGQGAGSAHADAAWGWAWTALGIGAMLGPIATLRLRALKESTQMAGGKR
ncbi:MAG: MFS transporter [Burkholderiales bacterium]|nr:MFS transporter [Burkholderiales bacterium]